MSHVIKIFLALALATSTVACDKLSSNEKISPTRDDKTFTMTVETVPESKILDFCTGLGVEYKADGCAKFNLDTKECTIFVVEPGYVSDTAKFSVIGHETWHCRFGKWHQ